MQKKLNIVVVDTDKSVHNALRGFYRDSSLAQITHEFTSPKRFLTELPLLDFDLCILEADMSAPNGLVLAQMMDKKPYIFITGNFNMLKQALDLRPLDIVTKPIHKERMDFALEKARKLIDNSMESAYFNIAESDKKLKLYLADIAYVRTSDKDPRNKNIVLKNKKHYTLMGCPFSQLLALAPHLIQINKKELLSSDMIHEILPDSILVRNATYKGIPKEIPVGNMFREDLFERTYFQ